MKKILYTISFVLFLSSCNNATIEKPDNLIDQATMENILYDLSILEAIKSQNPYDIENKEINPKAYIYKKYKTDSIQFTESNRYYVSQIEQYKKMYDNVGARIEREKKAADSLTTTNGKTPPIISGSGAGQVQ